MLCKNLTPSQGPSILELEVGLSLQTDGPHLLPISRHHPVTDLHDIERAVGHISMKTALPV